MMTLAELRENIDGLDSQIVELLKQRAAFVHEVGAIKAKDNNPIFVPERESDMQDKLLKLNAGVLPDKSLLSIYRQIVSCSFFLEGGMKVGYLGPEGTWSHQAALSRFGESVEMRPYSSFEEAFSAVERGEVDYGVIPIENSTDGSVSQAMDLFAQTDLEICAQLHLSVQNCLIGNLAPKDICTIYSHPQVLGQCRDWLQKNYPLAAQVPVASTSVAAQIANKEASLGSAALGSRMTAQLHQLELLEENVQDKASNTTRFVVIGKQSTTPSGNDRTTLCFSVPHTSGSLVDVLAHFKRHGVNIYCIGSRPTRDTAWEYLFYVDVQGHAQVAPLKDCIADMRSSCHIFKVLGSYPEQ